MRYFSDTGEQLINPYGMDNAEFANRFPGIVGRRSDSFSRFVGYLPNSNEIRPIVRMIDYKKNPSLHKCDARCQHAKGHKCECSCGGKNHGAG